MSIQWLAKAFSKLSKPPVSINEIRDLILKAGFVDAIEFYSLKSYHKIGGTHLSYEWEASVVPYAEPRLKTYIPFGHDLSDPWVRVACCKEMLHILEGRDDRSFTPEHVDALTRDLTSHSSPAQLIEKLGTEITNQWLALVVLVPIHLFLPYKQQYEAKQITYKEIADAFEIPEEMIWFLFTDAYNLISLEFLK